jgi:hypothetical protein
MIILILASPSQWPCRFLTMGGLTIVSTWLSEAATEEQTTVILIIFKVLIFLFSWACIYVYGMYIELSSHCCRCFFTFHYIKLCQPTCQLFCKLLTDCGFIGHKVCRNCHKTLDFSHTYHMIFGTREMINCKLNSLIMFWSPNYVVNIYVCLSSTALVRYISQLD